MSEITLEQLRRDGQAFTEEISRESYLAHSGHKRSAEFRPIYERYAHVLGKDALDLTLDLFKNSVSGTEEHRSAALLLEWQLESQASRSLAELDEREIAWESSAYIETADGERIQYQAAAIEIANERDRSRRLQLDAARAAMVEREHAPLRLERLQREKDYIESLGIAPNYNSAFEEITGVALSALAADCAEFLRETQSLWDETLPYYLRKSLGITPAEATRSDALALLRASEYDAAFPGSTLQASVSRQLRDMNVDPTADGRIIYDVGDRPGKRARAFCAPTRVPEEVYLVLRPHGGQSDYTTLLHEAGHALHFANVRADYPFEYKWLGDNSVTESYAMLFDHRMQDKEWLLRYTELGTSKVDAFLRLAGFEELHYLRRYCAKLIYEVEAYGDSADWNDLPDLYVETLTGATNFQYRAADAFIDFDPRYYSTRYLRAWQLQALINESLVERFDIDWFRNPSAGPWVIRELWAEGQRESAEELAARIAMKEGKLSFAPLIRNIGKLLGN
ncbi:MAG TPA: hypothetical protein VJL35_15715 [Gemmatimonadaceae bacterium]|jgi:hypothetical protein|nr:hypothetical protein [Gemmatimonadaceae bacterium]